ncbi:glucose dehydrogenase [FAD, quinone]-like [Ornithodoros turicata]|uniref:glucose dehydrogenase [FAD, quinone]-like n=1 Tax=Ornithodoros turicata TaxID=34597 RepID=UPI003138B1B2
MPVQAASSLGLVVTLSCLFSLLTATVQLPPDEYYDRDNKEVDYDFVVVGGGSAGCVVANRLSANPNVSVLLIEAGHAEDTTSEVPLLSSLQVLGPNAWKSRTVPQANACYAYKENRCFAAIGRVLGGGSVINGMLLVRGNRHDFDNWEANGATGWSYDDVLPHFKAIERFSIPEYHNTEYHSSDGELPENFAPWHSELSEAFLQGMKEQGFNEIDFNGANQTGHSFTHFNQENNRRMSSSKVFIRPVIQDRPNLSVTLGSVATKIEFEELRAVGVHYTKKGAAHYARARREVILCAGAIATPQLLMLSGVGPKTELDRLKIPTVVNLPVGENLQDHVGVGGVSATMERNAGINPNDPTMLVDYLLFGSGPLTVGMGVENVAFMNTPLAPQEQDYPDAQVLLMSVAAPTVGASLKAAGMKQEVVDKYMKPHQDEYGFSLLPLVLRPLSRGRVTLNSTNPFDYPVVDPGYLSHPADVQQIVEATKVALKILDTQPMQALGVKRWNISMPGCENLEQWSDGYIACLGKHMTQFSMHYSSTCPMGNDTNAVVDARLRVRGGVKNLRVVDCSIMPTIVSGNTNFPAMMIGDKGAAMVLQDNGISVD